MCFFIPGFGGRGGYGDRSGGFGRDHRGGDHDRRERKFEEFKAPDPGICPVMIIMYTFF